MHPTGELAASHPQVMNQLYYCPNYRIDCPFCARWTPLSNGDGLGIVRIEKDGLRTILYDSDDAAKDD